MRRFFHSILIGLLALSVFGGCETSSNIRGSIASKVDAITSDVNQDLFAKVPPDQLGGVKKAEFGLLVLKEKVKFAQLKDDLAGKQRTHADYELDLAKKNEKEGAVKLDIEKLEVMDRSGLGKKQDNIKTIAKLKAEVLALQADRVKIEAKLSTTQMDIETLKKQTAALGEAIQKIKME
ncbi:MAG: hypothetical protein Q8P24_02620 [Desulfobacterales bacterium]|nr:hypothetical protein [Desulfobacterales bacterium]